MIKKFVQGEETDSELFCLVGKFATDGAIHKAVGMAITSRDGDIWFIAKGKNSPIGFAQIRLLKNGKAHLRYLHSDSESIKLALAKKVTRVAVKNWPTIYTYDRNDAEMWTALGFEKIEGHCHGSFCLWERGFA